MPGAPPSTTAASERCRPDLEPRLIRCFSAAFPSLGPEELTRAEASSLEQWDSLAAMTLVALIEEEFRLRIPASDIPGLASFSAVLLYLGDRV